MKALVYHGPGAKAWEDVARPELATDTDAIVRVDTTTICGTDLHILKGDVPAMVDGRIIGHEAVGTVTRDRRQRQERHGRRPGPGLVRQRLRRAAGSAGSAATASAPAGRLDPRQRDRRHPGRVRAGSVRRQLDLSGAGRASATRSC